MIVRSIESGAIVQLPVSIQKSLLLASRNVSVQLTAMSNGTDAVIPFVSGVEELTKALWISNLQNMSGEILGFQEKLNQLKTLERRLRELEQRARSFEQAEARASISLEAINQAFAAAESLKTSLSETQAAAETNLHRIGEAQAASVAASASAQQNEKTSAEVASTARVSASDIDSLRKKAATTVSELDQAKVNYEALVAQITTAKTHLETTINGAHNAQQEYFNAEKAASAAERLSLTKALNEKQASLETTISSSLATAINAFNAQSAAQISASKSSFEAESTRAIADTKAALGTLESRSEALVKKNEVDITARMDVITELEKIYSEKIRLATNFQLFHSFDTRQKALAESVKYWQKALFISVGTSVGITLLFVIWIILKSPAYNAAFFLKLSFSIPLVYVVHFCSARFSEERRLEEEYAFKSNISISLEPYRELVERLVNKSDPVEAGKYLDFVLSSIDKVFASPTQTVVKERSADSEAASVKETTQGISKVIGSVTDMVQSLSKLK